MVPETMEGPVTANELTSFKNYINAVQPNTWTTVDNMANELAQYVTGQRLKAMGQMYELTGDVAILNRMIYFCDVVLSERNDILAAPYGQHVMWTGTITHDWIQSQTDPNATANATAGDGAGHLAYCAHLILTHASLLTQVVPDNDVYGHGTTYGDRAATFLAEADDVYSSTAFPYYLDLTSHANRMYWPANVPNFSGAVPWNQQAMFSWGMMHAAAAHAILGDNATLVSKYDGIVSTALSWLFTDSTSHTTYTDAAGNTAFQWGYNPSSYTSAVEDNSHGSLDVAWLYRCYTLSRYGVTTTQLMPLANTLCDVMLLAPKWMAGNVDGRTTGSGNSGPTTYVRDGWYLLTDLRPDKYYDVVTTTIVPGTGTTNIGAYANFLWVKSKRNTTGYSVNFSPLPTAYTTTQSVTLATSVSGASIRYTTNGSNPTPTTGTLYTGAISVAQTAVIKAIAYTGTWTSPVSTAKYTIWAATPTATPAAGTYIGTQSVTLSTTTSGATIRYTTDKTTPTATSGTIYSGSITVSASETIRAIAYTGTLSASNLRTAAYTIATTGAAATPSFSPVGGTYTSSQTVTISSTSSGASIYYTIDGSDPTTSSTHYTGPITVSAGTAVNAIAVASGLNNSAIGTANYIIGSTATPTLSLASGTYAGEQTVTIASGTAGATILFTLDGSTPTISNGFIYTGPFKIKKNTTVKVYAYSDLHTDSAIATGTYTIVNKIAVPAANVTASAYTSTFVPANTVDGSLSTRWAGNGDGVWIRYDLGATKTVSYVKLAWYAGTSRTYTFDVQLSTDGSTWTTVISRKVSSGATTALETYDFADASARYVRIVGHLSNVDNYTNITEAEVWGY